MRSGPGESPAERAKTPGIRVLVVDAEPLLRWALREEFTRLGWAVTEASTSQAAFAELEKQPQVFDVILLDHCLPDCRDLGVLARVIREAPASCVMLMTAFTDSDVRSQALALGTRALIDKPFRVDEVVARVESALGRSAGPGAPPLG